MSPAFTLLSLAYLDPGTGGMLLMALLGIVGMVVFSLKALYYKLKRASLSMIGVSAGEHRRRHGIVFYSEGPQYWNTFRPVIEGLTEMGRSCSYLTSSEDDPGLAYASDRVEARFIGAGNRAYAHLGLLEADLCALTTPGLDVLQIRRSRGVGHYTHIIHAPTDAAMYKLYSFDYFDSILTSGPHQKRTIRELERGRGTQPKELFDTGCCYLDVLAAQAAGVAAPDDGRFTVLVAPAWGENGLLKRYGLRLLRPLAAAGYKVIVRPHPQSYISERELVSSLEGELASYRDLTWDDARDGFGAMAAADVMVSDISGIIFDFAFLFQRPVLTLNSEVSTLGMEAADLPFAPWELTVLERVGERIDDSAVATLPERLREAAQSSERSERRRAISELRAESVYNFGCAGAVAARQIAGLADAVVRAAR